MALDTKQDPQLRDFKVVGTRPLRPDGIDRLFFGSDPDDVISELTERLGEPTSDTDWVDQNERFDGLCGGTEARFVTWESLQLFFTDRESAWAPAGTRHFASFSVEEGVADLEFVTSRGVGLGSSVAEIADAYGGDVTFGSTIDSARACSAAVAAPRPTTSGPSHGPWRASLRGDRRAPHGAVMAVLAAVQAGGLKTLGPPIFARYNAPFSLWFLRRNEVLVEVAAP